MKKIISFVALGLVLSIGISAQEKTAWKEMEDFHSVMGGTFHPAEEGNLQPIKKQSGEMLEKAIAWKSSDAPTGYNKKAIKSPLKKLVKGARKIDKMVKINATDKELIAELSGLHDIFHEIMEKKQLGDHDH